jgi:hypothetical protein
MNHLVPIVARSKLRLALGWCALVLGVATASLAAAQSEPGDLWEDSSEFAMTGMPAGMARTAQTHRRCSPRRDDVQPPIPTGDRRCEMSDVKRSADGMSWTMRCEGPPLTTGSGSMTYEGRDRYHGTMTMVTEGRTMTMKTSGRRIGECDAGESRRQLAATRAQVAAAQQQASDINALTCKSAVDNLMSLSLRPDSPHHCGASYKTDFCRRLNTPEGFAMVASRRSQAVAGYGSGDLNEAAAFCGADAEQLTARVCKPAEANESLGVLAAGCTARGYGRAIAQRECAGRSYSSPPAEKYREFCSTVARDGSTEPGSAGRMRKTAKGSAAEPAPVEAKAAEARPAETAQQAAVDKGKQLLKGLFGR